MTNNTTSKKLGNISSYFDESEFGDAKLFASMFTDHFCYDHSDKQWYVWDVQYWRVDKIGTVNTEIANSVAAEYLNEATQLRQSGDDAKSQEYIKRSNKLRSRRKIKNILELSTSLPSLGLTGNEWKVPPMELPVANGIIDLTTGSLRQGKPTDRIRTFAPTAWLGLNQPAREWNNFINEIFGGDQELVLFVQRLFGYAISGDIREQIMPIFWGEGSNGKSTLVDVISKILGPDFCFTTQADSLMDTRYSNGEAARPFVCALRDKRVVWASESKDGQSLNAGLVKQLTGDGKITARNLYSRPITFSPSHTIFLITNPLPDIPDGGDYAMIRRLMLVPFKIRFFENPSKPNERKLDKGISSKLEKEASGILAWLVRGCLEWQRNGLNPPETVKSTTAQYIEDADVIGLYIKENLLIGSEYKVSAGSLYQHYTDWCRTNGYEKKTAKFFGKQITRQFGESRPEWSNGRTQKIYRGIGLSTQNDP